MTVSINQRPLASREEKRRGASSRLFYPGGGGRYQSWYVRARREEVTGPNSGLVVATPGRRWVPPPFKWTTAQGRLAVVRLDAPFKGGDGTSNS